MIPQQVRRPVAVVLVAVAAAATAAAQNPSTEADRVICDQLRDLAHVKAAVQQTLSQSRAAEATIIALAKRLAGDLQGCSKTPDSPSCQPGPRSQMAATVQKLTAQVEDLQTARKEIEQRLQEIEARRSPILARLTDKDGCPHAR
jgi:hypothetical protein